MVRLKRIALGLLVAYAASMTLYASRMSAELFLYRRIMVRDPSDRARLSASDPLIRLARDYGADLSPVEYLAVRIADVQGLLMAPMIVLFFIIGLCAAWIPTPSRSNFDKD